MLLGGAMMIPWLFDIFIEPQEQFVFLFSALITLFFGGLMYLSCKPAQELSLSVREIFILTSLSWLVLGVFASLPFMIGVTALPFEDAYFEAISGLTTTGATVLTSLSFLPTSIVVWRSLLQWLGGIGIIVMALTILPFLRIGGMQLFHSEFSDRSEKILPKVTQIAAAIFSTYALLTLLCLLLLWVSGMTFSDALCYGLSTLSTGGFAPRDDSVASFVYQPHILAIMTVFMLVGGSTLLLFVRFGRGESLVLLRDAQVRVYLSLYLLTVLVLQTWRFLSDQPLGWHRLMTDLFSVASVLTTSGFTIEDYSAWGPFASMLFFFLMFVGGCTGSTSGGIKIFRFQVLYAVMVNHLKHLRHPHGIFVASYNKKPISEAVFSSVLTFFALYGITFAAIALMLTLSGLDFLSGLSGAVSALSNVGPALGPIIGPSGNFSVLDGIQKLIIMGAMVMGRLELLTVMIMFTTYFWRR